MSLYCLCCYLCCTSTKGHTQNDGFVWLWPKQNENRLLWYCGTFLVRIGICSSCCGGKKPRCEATMISLPLFAGRLFVLGRYHLRRTSETLVFKKFCNRCVKCQTLVGWEFQFTRERERCFHLEKKKKATNHPNKINSG